MEANEQPKLGIDTPKIYNFINWYSEVITKAEMIDYSDVSGCYVLRPWSYAIWEKIQEFFDREIKKIGVKNCYFPMLVSQAALDQEMHISDFAPEAAWITRSGNSEMAEPIAIRPTGEIVIYPSFAKWVQSHRDLPIKLNQWCNVVRWELKHPTPFLRTREFLWQEGHTAFQTRAEAEEEVYKILDLYAQIYKDLLAIPVVKGRKSDKEKFAGSDFTTTIEAFVAANGHMIPGATSHHLGQNFSKIFEIKFEDPKNPGQKVYAHQNSWRLSTRAIGAMIMIHGDNKGVVLPPRVAAVQMIVIPVGIYPIQNHEQLVIKAKEIVQILVNAGIRAESDLRDNLTPHWKLKYWQVKGKLYCQVKGVPVRVEVGIKDLAQNKVLLVQRFSGQKRVIPIPNIIEESKELLDEIHEAMYDKQVRVLDDHIKTCVDWWEFVETMNKTNLLLSPFCGQSDCEEQIKAKSDCDEPEKALGIKIVCIPFEQPWRTELPDQCINPDCTNLALFFALFGRSY